jgi:hypothetical protein
MLSLSNSKGNGKPSARTSNPGRWRAYVCVLGLVVRGTLRGLHLAVGHNPGG